MIVGPDEGIQILYQAPCAEPTGATWDELVKPGNLGSCRLVARQEPTLIRRLLSVMG